MLETLVERESSSWSQVPPNGFLLLCKLRSSEQTVGNICPRHTAAVAPSIEEGPGMLLAVATVHDGGIEAGQCFADVRAYERVYICLWESRVDAMAIFSPVHRVLPVLCCSVPRNMRKQPSTGIAPGLLPDPDPPAPPVGGTYEIPGAAFTGGYQQKERCFFLTDAMFTHLFPSALTNGLIIQLSHRNVISDLFRGEGYHSGTSPTQSEP